MFAWCAIINDIIPQVSANCRDIEDASARTRIVVVPHGQVTGWQGRGGGLAAAHAECTRTQQSEVLCDQSSGGSCRRPLYCRDTSVHFGTAYAHRTDLPAHMPMDGAHGCSRWWSRADTFDMWIIPPANKMNPRSRSRTPRIDKWVCLVRSTSPCTWCSHNT
jgi:hypothetical protein